jgi:hypothetical protein
MSHETELAIIRELDRLVMAAKASNAPDDWEAYDRAHRIAAAMLKLDVVADETTPALRREGRAA